MHASQTIARREPRALQLSEIPDVRSTPLEALELGETPTDLHFRRNHFAYPDVGTAPWVLEVAGAVKRPLRLTVSDLRDCRERTLDVVLECAGHRRAELEPRVAGLPWGAGAVSQARWTGVLLGCVLREAEPLPGACEAVLVGADRGVHDPAGREIEFARSIPLDKALQRDSLVAWAMNGKPLTPEHGAPLRAVIPGHYAVDSVKWLHRVDVVTEPFRGFFQETDYRFVGAQGVPNGTEVRAVPVHSLVTSPAEGDVLSTGLATLRGVAWGGSGIARVEISVDGGTWIPADLEESTGTYAFRRWSLSWEASPGSHQVAARATDRDGATQPARPLWNVRGYGNHSVHHVDFAVAG